MHPLKRTGSRRPLLLVVLVALTDALIAALYPERCTALDLEAGRAEVALLYQDPEDIDTARSALQALSEDLSEIALDPATRMRDEEEGE